MNNFDKKLNDHCNVLGLPNSYSKEELKKAYRKKAQENHPDKGGDELIMKKINIAYHELLKKIANEVPKGSTNLDNKQPINNCIKCGGFTNYRLCLDCWIAQKREEKRQRIHVIRSFMFCLNCDKSLYFRHLNTLFCNSECSNSYYKKRGNVEPHEFCAHNGRCLNDEEANRLQNLDFKKVMRLGYKERIGILTRLIGKFKAVWFDAEFQKKFVGL